MGSSMACPVTLAILTPRATRTASRVGVPGWPTLSPLACRALSLRTLQRLTLQRMSLQCLPLQSLHAPMQLQRRVQRLVQRLALHCPVVGPTTAQGSAPRAASALEVRPCGGWPRTLAAADLPGHLPGRPPRVALQRLALQLRLAVQRLTLRLPRPPAMSTPASHAALAARSAPGTPRRTTRAPSATEGATIL